MPGGLTLRLLSPHRDELKALIADWDKECRMAGLVKDVNGWREKFPLCLEHMGP
jgi:hypothetical protein